MIQIMILFLRVRKEKVGLRHHRAQRTGHDSVTGWKYHTQPVNLIQQRKADGGIAGNKRAGLKTR
jgi:hypothetical protein